jgi:glycosyl transferase family 25
LSSCADCELYLFMQLANIEAPPDIMKSSAKYVPIFVVSLMDAKDRRARISKKLEELGLDFDFVDAIDGRKKLPDSLNTLVDRQTANRRLGRPIVDAELACALSHVNIYQLLIESHHRGTIILEDDAIIGDGFKKFVDNHHYLDKNLVMLGYENARVSRFYRQNVFEQYVYRKLNFPSYLTVGYYISRQVAGELLRECTPVSYVADWGSDITRFDALAISPPVVGHLTGDREYSSLENSRFDAQATRGKNSALRFLRAEYWKKKSLKLISARIPGSSTQTGLSGQTSQRQY